MKLISPLAAAPLPTSPPTALPPPWHGASVQGRGSQVTVAAPSPAATPSGVSSRISISPASFLAPAGPSDTSLRTRPLPASITPPTGVPTTQVCRKVLSPICTQYCPCGDDRYVGDTDYFRRATFRGRGVATPALPAFRLCADSARRSQGDRAPWGPLCSPYSPSWARLPASATPPFPVTPQARGS